MVDAFAMKVGNPTRKLVLLKLADNANDDGECWPSYQHIADQCEISRRSAIEHIKALEKMGLVKKTTRKKSADENLSNVYKLNLSGEYSAPRGGEQSALGGEQSALGGSEYSAPRTTHSLEPINEPLKKHTKKETKNKKSELDYSCWPELPDKQILADWLDLRKRLRAGVSQTVINRFGNELTKAAQHGYTVDQCLTEVITRGWRGFEAQWLINQSGNHASNQPIVQQKPAGGFVEKHTDRSWAE